MAKQGQVGAKYSTDYRRFENVPSDDDEDEVPASTVSQNIPAGCVCDACVVRWKTLSPTSAQAFVSVCAMMSRLAETTNGGADGTQALACTAGAGAGLEDISVEEQLAALSEGVPKGLLPDESALKRFEGALAAGSTQEGAIGTATLLTEHPGNQTPLCNRVSKMLKEKPGPAPGPISAALSATHAVAPAGTPAARVFHGERRSGSVSSESYRLSSESRAAQPR